LFLYIIISILHESYPGKGVIFTARATGAAKFANRAVLVVEYPQVLSNTSFWNFEKLLSNVGAEYFVTPCSTK